VIKKNKQEDKRAFVIAISPDGQKIVDDLNHQLNQWNDYLADGMDNKDMANLFSVLDKMAAKALIAEEEGYGVILQNVVKPE
jgi:DNA-binding MarR family transcriptional regulator